MPETENPAKQDVTDVPPSIGVAELSDGEYHDLADAYLEGVLSRFEQLQDTREDIEVEYSVRAFPLKRIDEKNKGKKKTTARCKSTLPIHS